MNSSLSVMKELRGVMVIQPCSRRRWSALAGSWSSFDNEWGYSNKVCEMAKVIMK